MSIETKILVVEDEPTLLEALVDKLKREGFFVLSARDGESGLALALKEHPQLILMDVVMPKMDGMKMLEELRKDQWGQHVPVILLTNLNDPEKIADAMESGVSDYMVKTEWEMDDVVAKVRQRLAHQ